MTNDDLLRYYGSAAKAMEALGLTRKTIYRWKGEPPIEVQCMIEVLTVGHLRANRDLLRERIESGAKYRMPLRRRAPNKAPK